MVFARCVLAVGLILAALSGSTARAQEAEEFAAGEAEMEFTAVFPEEFSPPVESVVLVAEPRYRRANPGSDPGPQPDPQPDLNPDTYPDRQACPRSGW